jgi:DNA-binding response OmpR family regulator
MSDIGSALASADMNRVKSTAQTQNNFVKLRVAMLGGERELMFALRHALLTAGHTAQHYRTAAEFLNAVNSTGFEALILGSLGHGGEVDVLARMRRQMGLSVPVIVVTTQNIEDYVVGMLHTGADDCIVMPVGQREFLARLEAVARRWIHCPAPPHSFRVGSITVHVQSRRVLVDGRPVELTSKDFDLALLLLRNVGRLISRSQILHAVWGGRQQLIRSRTMDTHISRVRRRLQLVESRGWRLRAVYRKGYRIERIETDADVPDDKD